MTAGPRADAWPEGAITLTPLAALPIPLKNRGVQYEPRIELAGLDEDDLLPGLRLLRQARKQAAAPNRSG
ncbi:MAG: hypothetical protein JSR28_16310 [Proteobacteria bacterium]|nr:hypothetical protein [Pseudomonadota bacterium]